MIFNNFKKKNEESIKNYTNENLTENEFYNLLYNMGMISNLPKSEEERNEEKEKNDEEKNEENIEKMAESQIQQDEKRLLNLALNSLKNSQNEINKEDIKNF